VFSNSHPLQFVSASPPNLSQTLKYFINLKNFCKIIYNLIIGYITEKRHKVPHRYVRKNGKTRINFLYFFLMFFLFTLSWLLQVC